MEQLLALNLTMSPRAVDDLRRYSTIKGISKYELSLVMFPDNKTFDVTASVNDEQKVQFCFNINGQIITLVGRLEHNNFFCTSVNDNKTDGKKFILYFMQDKNEDFTYIDENVKKRLSMWYDYIESVMKKAEKNSYVFFCKGAVIKNNLVEILTYDLKPNANLRGLTVGHADENNRPSWGFGNIERLAGDTLIVKTINKKPAEIMKELASGIKLIAYDGASDITCKRMKSGLDKLCKGEAVNKRLPEFIFEPLKANRSPGENIRLNEDELLSKNMNSEQIAAVEGVLNAEDLYLIQGPPGTGKTTVIAEICYQNAIRGLKTLIVSQSNLAVDNAVSRVMNHADVRVLRKGDALRVEEEGKPFTEDNVVGTWIRQISAESEKMDKDISEKIYSLKKWREQLPDFLSVAENINELKKIKIANESQLYFYKNVYNESRKLRKKFFELVSSAYETDNIEFVETARNCYPDDFIIPNEIYNNVQDKYLDIKADLERLHQYDSELKLLNSYTEKFTRHFKFIQPKINKKILSETGDDRNFYTPDENAIENKIKAVFDEGENVVRSHPKGLMALVLGYKWRKTAYSYYKKAESLVMSIQLETVRLCEKIYNIRKNPEFLDNVQSFHISLDALCEDFDEQYYKFKAKGENYYQKSNDSEREYEYAVEEFREKIQGEYFSRALKNTDVHNINLEEIEYNINTYYQIRYTRYTKWKNLLDEWRMKIADGSSKNYNALKKLYIDNANVIGITCIQSGTKDFDENYPSFDVVIIDEASKSTPPDIILPMLKGKKIVLVGDHKQLPPFIDSNAYDELDEEDESLKELIKMSLFEELYTKSENHMRTMLFRQYRMHRDIAALINQFYINTDAGRLESPASEFKKHCCQGTEITEDNHVLWYDVPNSQPYYEKNSDKSFCNAYEVECVRKILCILEKNLSENDCKKSVGVITFYDAQVKLLEEEIVNSGFSGRFGHFTLRIGSVDRFQGMEEDIIIVSFVRNNPNHAIGFARDSRRINVAMSRAKDLLVIVGSSANFINSSDEQAAEMFRNIYVITQKLDGLRDSENIPNINLKNNNYKTAQLHYVNEINSTLPDSEITAASDEMNILDYFILKASYDFKEQHLSVNNISNALGIAPVFVISRVKHLQKSGLLEYRNKLVKINNNGEKTIIKLCNDKSL